MTEAGSSALLDNSPTTARTRPPSLTHTGGRCAAQELEIGELLEQDDESAEKAPPSEAAIVAQAATRAYLARKKSKKLVQEKQEAEEVCAHPPCENTERGA